MNRRWVIAITAVLAVSAFAAAGLLYDRAAKERQARLATPTGTYLVRPHSPVIGPRDARVTIVEFFDPSCETCRAFYPS